MQAKKRVPKSLEMNEKAPDDNRDDDADVLNDDDDADDEADGSDDEDYRLVEIYYVK
jgi:hypothetical protein